MKMIIMKKNLIYQIIHKIWKVRIKLRLNLKIWLIKYKELRNIKKYRLKKFYFKWITK
jgi:hypothetical protein